MKGKKLGSNLKKLGLERIKGSNKAKLRERVATLDKAIKTGKYEGELLELAKYYRSKSVYLAKQA